MKTLLLDVDQWDLVATVSGNIAVASEPYAQAQDAASAIRLFAGELWYDTTKGLPYWPSILGKPPSLAFLKAKFVEAAMTVPGVTAARAFLASFKDRIASGQVQITTDKGASAASF